MGLLVGMILALSAVMVTVIVLIPAFFVGLLVGTFLTVMVVNFALVIAILVFLVGFLVRVILTLVVGIFNQVASTSRPAKFRSSLHV